MATLAAEKAPPKPTAELEALYRQVEEWLSEPDADGGKWRVSYGIVRPNVFKRPDVEDIYGLILDAPEGGDYLAHTLDGEHTIHIEPLGKDRQGRPLVELYGWPTLIRVRLRMVESGRWEIETDTGIPFHLDWTRENFIRLLYDLLTYK